VFVTGTDTNVGKTVVCAALLRRYQAQRLGYWKPVQTGIEQDDDTAEVVRLSACRPDDVLAEGVRLERPVSPHLAARLAGTAIDLDRLMGLAECRMGGRPWIVEGAGGVLVPLTEGELMIDLMARLRLPALIVARSTLGTINHTLLTVEALERRSIAIAGVVLVGEPDADNREAIETYGAVRVVGELPMLSPLEAGTLGAWAHARLDPDGQLARWLA
jgi:malonyl-CoA O-methyltransferase